MNIIQTFKSRDGFEQSLKIAGSDWVLVCNLGSGRVFGGGSHRRKQPQTHRPIDTLAKKSQDVISANFHLLGQSQRRISKYDLIGHKKGDKREKI